LTEIKDVRGSYKRGEGSLVSRGGEDHREGGGGRTSNRGLYKGGEMMITWPNRERPPRYRGDIRQEGSKSPFAISRLQERAKEKGGRANKGDAARCLSLFNRTKSAELLVGGEKKKKGEQLSLQSAVFTERVPSKP